VARVYSSQLFRRASYSGIEVDVYTSPPGFVTVIRTLIISVGTNVLGGGGYIKDDTGGVIAFNGAGVGFDAPLAQISNMRLVMTDGQTLTVSTTGGWIADFFGSGYLLTLP